jgi:MFS family permease
VTARPPRAPVAVAVAGLVALAIAMGIGRFAFTPVLPMMQEGGVLTIAAGGWLAAANYFGYLVGALSAVAIRIRPATTIRAGLIVIVVTTVGMGLAHGFEVWAVLRAVAGFASAWVLISVSAWTLTVMPVGRPLLSGAVFAGVGVGIAAAGLLTLLLMYLRATAAQTWIALGGLAFVMTAGAWPFFSSDVAIDRRHARAPSDSGSARSSDGIRLILCYGAFGFGYIIPATFLPVMARDVVHDRWIFGWTWPVFGAAAGISTFAGGVSRAVGGNRRLWLISQLVMAFGICMPVIVPGLVSVMLSALAVGGTFMVNTMVGMQEARAVAGPDATRLMATMTTAFAIGQIIGPIVVSYSVTGGGHFATPLLIAAGALSISACLLATGRRAAKD